MKLTLVGGARPNFMKIAPLIHEIIKAKSSNVNIEYQLIHTGQHFDAKMSDTFFTELEIPPPNVNFGCGGGTQAEITGAIMIAFENYLLENPTDLVIVVGDVTSTLACSIVAKKLNIKVAHVEAGIRSNDMTMPEEINRLVTDSITDYFFTTSPTADANLFNEGVPRDKVFFVGNVMIDTLLKNMPKFKRPALLDQYKINAKEYFVVTLHRPANVDNPFVLKSFIETIVNHSADKYVIFPMHPRTKKIFDTISIHFEKLIIIEPLGYFEFNYLVQNSFAVITDSGGITEETTVMGIPCLTLRDNTERPETVEFGTNKLIGTNPLNIIPEMVALFDNKWKKGQIPLLWDGKSASRIINHLIILFEKN